MHAMIKNITPALYGDRVALAQSVYAAALSRVQPEQALHQRLLFKNGILSVDSDSWKLDDFRQVLVLGAGKASGAMAQALESILGSSIDHGLIITSDGNSRPTQHIMVEEARHPIPDERGLSAARRLLDFANSADTETLVLFLLSGGASALLTLPVETIQLKSVQEMTRLLLRGGADIGQINTIRKQISTVKGGNLALRLSPATVVTLTISDVLGSPPSVIGSGPTVPESAQAEDALEILKYYGLMDQVHPAITTHLLGKTTGEIPTNPGKTHTCFQRSSYHIIAENQDALVAAAKAASDLGFEPHILSEAMQGEAKKVANEHIGEIGRWLKKNNPTQPQCFLHGGETTVTVLGSGQGGRNQEYVLAAVEKLPDLGRTLLMSAGTDGIDGPTDAAGAWADAETAARAKTLNLDVQAELQQNNAYVFFDKLKQLFITGPTGTNVMDLVVYLWYPEQSCVDLMS